MRISELWCIEAAFTTGVALLGIISLGAGFSSDKVVLIVLRALTGIGTSGCFDVCIAHFLDSGSNVPLMSNTAAALTIPSALTLIVNIFPEPLEQARAIGLFGGCGCVGNGGITPTTRQITFEFYFSQCLV
jgi:MFS family permease